MSDYVTVIVINKHTSKHGAFHVTAADLVPREFTFGMWALSREGYCVSTVQFYETSKEYLGTLSLLPE